MEELLISLLIIIGGFTENLKNLPKELSSLASPEIVLKRLKVSNDEKKLISLLDTDLKNPTFTPVEIKQAVADLGDANAAKRHAAGILLRNAGFASVPYLEKVLESRDPEVRLTAKEILTEINNKEKLKQKGDKLYVKKLMAIKALQQMKSKEALPVLKKLVACNVPRTLADAASDAILTIEGKEIKLPNIDETVKDIVNKMPDNISSAAILRLDNNKKPLDIIKFLKDKKNDDSKIMAMLPKGALQDLGQKLPDAVVEVLSTTGNLRIDAIAAMISSDLGQRRDSGYLGFVFKGSCETSMLNAALASDFRKSFKYKNKTVYYSYDISVCLLDSKTLIVAVGDANDGRHILPMLKSFSAKKKKFSEKVFIERFPLIAPALKDVIAGKYILGIGASATEAQQALCDKGFSREMVYMKKRLANRPSSENKLELNFLESALSVIKAKHSSGKITKDGLIEIQINCDNKDAAEELTKSVKEMEKSLRGTLKEMGKHRRFREMNIVDSDVLDKPLFNIENKNDSVKLNVKMDAPSFQVLVMILMMGGM